MGSEHQRRISLCPEDCGSPVTNRREGVLEFPAMIAFTLNGESRQVPAPIDVAQLLDDLGYTGKRVAVEKDGAIVPKSRHAATMIEPGSRIEIVVAVGGG